MPVEYGRYDDDPELESGAVVAKTEDAWLILDEEHADEPLSLRDIDNEPARVRIHTVSEADGLEYTEMTFETFQMARLAFGLWERCGPFTQPEGGAIPVEVATSGQEAIGAYLRLGNGYPKSREYVAEKMDITPATVSNYCNRVRWKP
jgi:hypothetical protein